jgi:hypothetical protein
MAIKLKNAAVLDLLRIPVFALSMGACRCLLRSDAGLRYFRFCCWRALAAAILKADLLLTVAIRACGHGADNQGGLAGFQRAAAGVTLFRRNCWPSAQAASGTSI